MSRRNRVYQSRVKGRGSSARLRAHIQAPRDRRGVLLLVVLSLLVLFMLIGTAFLMSSNQYKTSASASAKHDRVGNFPTELLDRALMQVLCDTGNPASVIRNHSLLRDFYGTEGFEAAVYSPRDNDLDPDFPNPISQLTRYATEPTGPYNGSPKYPDPTRGQLIDIYVRALAYNRFGSATTLSPPFSANDPTTSINESTGNMGLYAPDARHVLRLEPNVNGTREVYDLPLTKGYFNGCLMTFTSGPAAGESTRIVDYEYLGDIAPNLTTVTPPRPSRLFRFRVMAFPRSDGSQLLTRQQLPTTDPRYSPAAARGLELVDLVTEDRLPTGVITSRGGMRFIVNGRPFSGTGVGLNELAKTGEPRLNAREGIGLGNFTPPTPPGTPLDDVLYPQLALAPNSAFSFNADPAFVADATNAAAVTQDAWGARYFEPASGTYLPLNPTAASIVSVASRPLLWKYPTFSGPGDADESYDAADAQNMFLALQTVTPRARARVVHGRPTNPIAYEIDSSQIIDNNGNYANTGSFLRLDLEDLPWPSYHRPDLENYWFHRMVNYAITVDSAAPDDAVRAVIAPYGADGIRAATGGDDPAVSVEIRDQFVALKRKISLRPLPEDHPNFDGSNPASRPPALDNSSGLVRNGNIAIPFWEATGPWDVDNDNDGVPDSNWVDLGDPVQQAEDGTLYKPMYAFLIVDLDSRLNVNAHGLVDHLRSPQLDATLASGAGYGNLAHDIPLAVSGAPTLYSSNFLPAGSGYGPAEISLRPLFSPNLPGNTDLTLRGRIGNPAYDDYARILVGRPDFDGRPQQSKQSSVWGRHGSVNVRGNVAVDWTDNLLASREAIKVRPGIPFDVTSALTQAASLDRLTAFKFFGYPLWLSNYYDMNPFDAFTPPTFPTAFGQVPDLLGRYALGLDYAGQPASEAYGDSFYTASSGDPDLSLLYDTPYELDLSESRRRDTPAASVTATISAAKTAPLNDDAPFATADLEHILRAHDADSGILPDRLWSVVDAFDPLKLRDNQPQMVDTVALANFGSTGRDERLAAAQQLAEVNRRLVTTDSYDIPVPTGNFLKRLIYGADGQPGVAGVDDDNDTVIDDVGNPAADDEGELGWYNSDDWYAVMYHQPLPLPAPALANFNPDGSPKPPAGVRLEPQNPTVVDLLRYRVQYERRKRGVAIYLEPELSLVTQQLLAPEILAGGKMDLNRPFGDGIDNAGDGIDNNGNGQVDEPGEPGDPFNRADGIVDDPLEAGEPFVDHDPDGTGINASGNGKWDVGEEYFDLDGNGAYTPPRDQLWQGLTSEPVGFSHNHGGVTTDGRWFDFNNDGDVTDATDGRLRYNGIIQRQTYARQLYSLMMLLVDENYIASQNVVANSEGNINLQIFFRDLWRQIAYELAEERGRAPVSPDLVPTPIQQDYTDAQPTAERLALQKLTARKIAQWAINVVDYRDTDSEMTAFEYDENPFDGWGLFVPDPADPTDPPIFVPIDGDLGTNENWGGVKPFQVYPTKFDRTAAVASPNNAQDDANAVNSTRGVVWGTERPELLITETLAFHDRRCTDEAVGGYIFPPGSPNPDDDLDQRLKPRGALYLELYNPWPEDGQQSADLYGRDSTSANPKQGVMLNRLSAIGVPTTGGSKRSPVWRVAVVQDPINGRLTNQIIDISTLTAPAGAEDREALASQFLTTDASGFGFDSDLDAERLVYFTTGRDYTTNLGSDPDRSNDNVFDTEYLNLPDRLADPNSPNLSVWVPPLPYRIRNGLPELRTAKRYFIARTERDPGGLNDADVPIAPILPGRYAVVGPSGLQLDASGSPVTNPGAGPRVPQPGDRYVLPISRLQKIGSASGTTDQMDNEHLTPGTMLTTRRIELWPSVNPDSPVVPNVGQPAQLLVDENGAQEIVSDRNGNFVNVTDANGDGTPDATIVDTPVAIPVEDLNISEPVEAYRVGPNFKDGYPTERYIEMSGNSTLNPGGGGVAAPAVEATVNLDGELAYNPPNQPYDRPLDMDPELIRNGTTQNYRSIHLQRLANPQFPWNPPRFDDQGRRNDMHRPHLPINPYVTIDSQSSDLTAFNGASILERTALPVPPPSPPSPTFPTTPTPLSDLTQGDYFAPLSAGEYLRAPDHVLAGLISQLAALDSAPIPPWTTVEEFRGLASPADEARVNTLLDELERDRGGNLGERAAIKAATEWGWHRMVRVLPDDLYLGTTGYKQEDFRQRLNLKSLERGAHYQAYFKYPQPGSPEGWWFDTRWEPRLLWKQERPNTMLFLRDAAGSVVRVTDMRNVRSRRQLQGTTGGLLPQDSHTQDDERKANYLIPNNTMPDHVINFALEHTLGFVNESYAPDLDRNGGVDENAVLMTDPNPANQDPQPGAPEVATDPRRLVAPQAEELNRWNTLTPEKVLILPEEELQRRQRLMRSTFPWLAWNNRPFANSDELLQVPAASPSLMLREYSVATRNTANPYDGDGMTAGAPATLETVNERLARQQGTYGHLLNFFQAADRPAGTYTTAPGAPLEPLSGGPNYYRLLDFVEVPSKFVGTDTLLSPEVFNDNPTVASSATAPGEDITALNDPRILLQPPFNKVSRQRDPGRVNLNTVTGRRRVESTGFVRHWSEVYDGIMHRYGDSNLMDPSAATPTPLSLSHFGPAWRDVALSRRGYAEYFADPTESDPIEKIDTMKVEPETYAFGLNRNFPSIFSNPFRSSDAGDLVPLANMMRPGVESTFLRGHHWQRADDNTLITNPYASITGKYQQIAWGQAGIDDDGNGIIDDVREAGYGVIDTASPFDGDTLRIVNSTQALESSSIPLFSEQLPGPAVDAERNPGMMYQPMTRLNNLVTTRSNVYAIWVTVGYFEVQRAPDWNDPIVANRNALRARFGATNDDAAPRTIRGRALYDRVYPDGYTLGEELGTDTGETNRERAFYIIDRTEPVGFKPGEDLNVDKMIRVRRRIE